VCSVLRHYLALYVELTSQKVKEVTIGDNSIRVLSSIGPSEGHEQLIDRLKSALDKLVNTARLGIPHSPEVLFLTALCRRALFS